MTQMISDSETGEILGRSGSLKYIHHWMGWNLAFCWDPLNNFRHFFKRKVCGNMWQLDETNESFAANPDILNLLDNQLNKHMVFEVGHVNNWGCRSCDNHRCPMSFCRLKRTGLPGVGQTWTVDPIWNWQHVLKWK